MSALIVGAALLFFALPGWIDRDLNRVTGAPPAPSPRALSLHQTLWIADLHADTLLWQRDLLQRGGHGHLDLPRMQEGNIALQAFSVVTKTPRGLNLERNGDDSDNITALSIAQGLPPAAWTSLMARAELQAQHLRQFADGSNGALRLIGSRAQLQRFIIQRRAYPQLSAGWLTLEGAHALEGKLDNLDRLYRAGYRMAAPTHFFDTELSGSRHGLHQGGLTALGRAWVAAMESRRMIIDLAHASPATIDQVLDLARRPLMVSHTGVRGTCDNRRNLTDKQLRRIAAQGGLVGIGFWDTAVCGKDVAAIARAIRYAIAVAGIDHVAYGSDFDGAVGTAIDAAHMASLTQALLDAGLNDSQIRQVAGGNVQRFLLDNLPDDDA